MYYPEGLAPAFEMDGYSHPRQSRDNHGVKTLSIVIPAYNEEDCIESTTHLISERLERDKIDYEILVVNDNSKDNTEAVLQKINQENPRIRYINNYYPNGFGFAVRCGLENFSGDAVAVVMADNSDSPDNWWTIIINSKKATIAFLVLVLSGEEKLLIIPYTS